jgi:hypothetical protein
MSQQHLRLFYYKNVVVQNFLEFLQLKYIKQTLFHKWFIENINCVLQMTFTHSLPIAT